MYSWKGAGIANANRAAMTGPEFAAIRKSLGLSNYRKV
jgi:hypothetical protein